MKVLITGVNGFIGNSICEYLDKLANYKIYGIGRGQYRYAKNVNYLEVDIGDDRQVDKILSKIDQLDAIIHCAACIDKNDFNPALISSNCQGTQNILKLGKEKGIKKIIYISSIPVIGIPLYTPISEEHAASPMTMYHASKLMGEHIVAIGEKYGIDSISLRIPSPVGTGMKPNTILPTFVRKCLRNENIELSGTGKRIQNYIAIKDICEAIYLCLIKDVKGVFNIANTNSYSNKEIANICRKTLYSKSKILFSGEQDSEEDHKWIISTEKAKTILGFESKYNIEDIIINLAKNCKV